MAQVQLFIDVSRFLVTDRNAVIFNCYGPSHCCHIFIYYKLHNAYIQCLTKMFEMNCMKNSCHFPMHFKYAGTEFVKTRAVDERLRGFHVSEVTERHSPDSDHLGDNQTEKELPDSVCLPQEVVPNGFWASCEIRSQSAKCALSRLVQP